MALNIKDRRTEEVVRRLAQRTGQSITEAVTVRDVYEARTVIGLAQRVSPGTKTQQEPAPDPFEVPPVGRNRFQTGRAQRLRPVRPEPRVCRQGTHWHLPECAQECARTRPEAGHSAANANHAAQKNGPEILNFRPVP